MRKKSNFTQRCIQEIESIPILQIARDFGMELKRSGREYKVPGNGGLTLNPEKNCWYCFTLDEKVAKGPIGFVEYITGYGFRETVKLLADMYRVPLEQEEMEYEKLYREKRTQIVQEKEKNIILPKKGTTCRHLFAYLCKTRKVGREVVEYFLKAGRLYENDLHSCVFVGLDPKGKPRHCAIRGTVTNRPFKGEAKGSDKRYAFSKLGKTDTLHIFEAPIDLMSYLTLYPEEWGDHYLALCCLADTALEEYLKNYKIKILCFHLDNDEWGERKTKEYIEKYKNYDIWDQRPQKIYKDFNEYLIAVIKIEEKEKRL